MLIFEAKGFFAWFPPAGVKESNIGFVAKT
jgi:hypothetical protein